MGSYSYVVRLKNAGTAADTITLKGGTVPSGWSVLYGDTTKNNADITAAMTAGLQKTLAAGATFDVLVQLTPGSTVASGASADLRIAATSGTDASKTDAVHALATVTAATATGKFTLIADPATGATVGKAVTLTTTGLSSGYEYRFFIGSNNAWTPIRAYAVANGCSWTPTTAGLYNLLVWARKVGSTRDWELNTTVWNYVVGSASTSGVSLFASPSAGAKAGAAVTLSAQQTGIKKPEYAFYTSNGSAWTLQRPYAATASASWTPTLAGKYALLVYVREQGSNATYQLSGMIKEFVVAAK